VPAAYRNPLVTRLKIMCDLDISEKRKPQDGKIKFKKFGPLDIELRVATIPTAGGVEDVVMRILAAGEPIPLDKLGILPQNMEKLKGCINKPYGLFFVCGPTGSARRRRCTRCWARSTRPTPRSGPRRTRSRSRRRACASAR
jgi:type II secretory ATPase GspE/PulE/Tfp pilus assembly ATPase PilB-like protein